MIDFTCNDVNLELPTYPENTFDGCLCDPPYGLEFMGKTWDHGVPSVEVWREVLRVLKPGAMLMAFGGTRTWHRLACAIEDAGFEIRDCMMWLYGSGFPKSLDISKAIDKAARGYPQGGIDPSSPGHGKYKSGCSEENPSGRGFGAGPGQFMKVSVAKAVREGLLVQEAITWSGYGTALKPAWEPIILAMKPCEGTFVENTLKWGVAGLGIDRGRIVGYNPSVARRDTARRTGTTPGHPGKYSHTIKDRRTPEAYCADHVGESLGRWPANLLLDEEAADILDGQVGDLGKSTGGGRNVGGLSNTHHKRAAQDRGQTIGFGDSGGASRFFYCAKASRKERGEGNTHPTVKPLSLCTYLARLILPLPVTCRVVFWSPFPAPAPRL